LAPSLDPHATGGAQYNPSTSGGSGGATSAIPGTGPAPSAGSPAAGTGGDHIPAPPGGTTR
jgi:hypothetical protein